MTADQTEKLKALALAIQKTESFVTALDALHDFEREATPAAVLELIADNERLRAELATRCRAEGGGTSKTASAGLSPKGAETRMDASSCAGAGSAPAAGADKDVLRLFLGAAYPVAPEINPRGYNWCEAYLDQARDVAIGARAKAGKPT